MIGGRGERVLRRTSRGATAAILSALLLLVAVGSALAVTGALTQAPGPAGCVSETGSAGQCRDARAFDRPAAIGVSADGKNVYTVSENLDAVAVFKRNQTTGGLVQLAGPAGCVSETGSGGECRDGRALAAPRSLAVSPDGLNVYVGSQLPGAVVVFRRDPATGALSQLAGRAGCMSEGGLGGECRNARAMLVPRAVGVSPDGENVYVGSQDSNAIAVFRRDPATGGLAQIQGPAGCISETGSGGECRDGKALQLPRSLAVSADGESVYAASQDSDAVAVFKRNPANGALAQFATPAGCVSETGSGGECQDGRVLDLPFSVAIAPDGENVYVASLSPSAVAVLKRNPVNGALVQLVGSPGCVSETGSGGECRDARALEFPNSLAVSPDGGSVYVASESSDAVAFFVRGSNGALTQPAGPAGCLSETGSGGTCRDGRSIRTPFFVTVSADGENVYASSFFDNAIAVLRRQQGP